MFDVRLTGGLLTCAGKVAGSPAGVVGDGNQPASRGEVAGARESAQVTGADEQRSAEERPEARHRLDDRGLRVLIERGGDLAVEALHPRVEATARLLRRPPEFADRLSSTKTPDDLCVSVARRVRADYLPSATAASRSSEA